MEKDSEIDESIEMMMRDMRVDEASFAEVVDSAIRSRTPSISEVSLIPSFASVIDSMIKSRTPSNLGTSPVHSFASPVDTNTVATGLSEAESKAPEHFVHGFQLFTLSEIVVATNNFSNNNKISVGSFGFVYSGRLIYGREVAIKRLETSSNINQFQNQYQWFKLHHKNLVRLLGSTSNHESKERILVYEYIKNGSLSDNLHKLQNSALMSWPVRIKVALEADRGIENLHHTDIILMIHPDINSDNILLDSNLTAKVSDFGHSLMSPDPEYSRLQHLTPKSDVYNFGVVLLELLSGLKPIHKNENGIPRNVVDFVVPFIVQDEIHKVLDPRMPPPTPFETEAVVYVAYLAADCVRKQGRDRPTMSQVVNTLEKAFTTSLVHPIQSTSSSHSSQ